MCRGCFSLPVMHTQQPQKQIHSHWRAPSCCQQHPPSRNTLPPPTLPFNISQAGCKHRAMHAYLSIIMHTCVVLCMQVDFCTCVVFCMRLSIGACTHAFLHACAVGLYARVFFCMSISVHPCMCVFLCACRFVHAHTFLCMQICMHTWPCTRVVWGMHACVSAHASLHTHHCSKAEDCITLLTAFFCPPFNHFNFNCCAGTAMPMCHTTRE